MGPPFLFCDDDTYKDGFRFASPNCCDGFGQLIRADD